MIQTEQILYERNIYLIRNFLEISKIFYSNWFFLHKPVKYDLKVLELLKSKEILVLAIASLILLPFLGVESFAQSNQVLTVMTEKESYAAGEPVEILGLVDIVLEGTPVVIRIVSPMGNMIHPAQIDVDLSLIHI